jgi:2-keto-4-pentenoate hydratase/2-oxohepta-3-ene-1,7-dioic acid hydratase in catechol pathway
MALNVVRFQHGTRTQWGVIRQGRITPVPGEFPGTAEFIRGTSIAALEALDAPQIAESAVRVLSPVTRDRQFVCQGANYRQHMIESGMDPDAKSFNMIFTKASSCIVGADSDVVRPSFVQFLDYEIELGLVLRRDITAALRVTDETLHEAIAGLVIVNDYSARDVQIPQSQFYKGKSYRTFGPVGPYLCLLEPQDFPYLRKLQLTLSVNGEIRQNDDTGNLVHRPAATLSELSGVQDLFAGDLLATGTPAGCALSIPPPSRQRIAALLSARKRWELFKKAQARRAQYLKPGDVVEARIRSADGAIDLGVQRNRVVSAAA